MSLSEHDRAIWSAMGLGPVWIPRHGGQADQLAADVRNMIAWVGQFETAPDEQGRAWPVGTAGQLLLNMLTVAGIKPDEHVFLGLLSPNAGSAPAAIAEQVRLRLGQSACAKAVLMGEGAARVLSALEPAGIRASNTPYRLQLDTHEIACLAMEGLPELLSEPQKKALAWASLCHIKSCFTQAEV